MNSVNNSPSKSNKIYSFLLDAFDSLLKALIAIVILTTFIFRICTVVGDSMNNTLANGEKLVISDLFYEPKENDIIVFHQLGSLNEPVVKRVIATGGKWIKIDYDNCTVFVSEDSVFEESDIVDESGYAYFDSGSYKKHGSYSVYVPEGYLFVMGDNRNNSLDSRFEQIGLVDERSVLGKVIFRLSPDALGPVD